MSIKVTIHNYMFPIHFRYKGWRVKLEKKIDLFKDVKVEATFTPPHIDFDYWNIIVPDEVEQILKKEGLTDKLTMKNTSYIQRDILVHLQIPNKLSHVDFLQMEDYWIDFWDKILVLQIKSLIKLLNGWILICQLFKNQMIINI